jgi:hypothetical protein
MGHVTKNRTNILRNGVRVNRNPPSTKVIADQTDTSYNYTSLSNNVTYYWKIVSWDNHHASASSPIWHFTTESHFEYNLGTGWNLITIPAQNNWWASDIADNLTGCTSISRWDAVNQTYRTYIVGGPPTFDFKIIDGSGYFVDMNQIDYLRSRYPNHVIGFSTHECHDWITSITMLTRKEPGHRAPYRY